MVLADVPRLWVGQEERWMPSVVLRRWKGRLREAERAERALACCHGRDAVAKREAKRRRRAVLHAPYLPVCCVVCYLSPGACCEGKGWVAPR